MSSPFSLLSLPVITDHNHIYATEHIPCCTLNTILCLRIGTHLLICSTKTASAQAQDNLGALQHNISRVAITDEQRMSPWSSVQLGTHYLIRVRQEFETACFTIKLVFFTCMEEPYCSLEHRVR